MQNHYEINVSLNGRHFFATSPRSCVDKTQAQIVAFELQKRFPVSEGFKVTCTYWQASGKHVSF